MSRQHPGLRKAPVHFDVAEYLRTVCTATQSSRLIMKKRASTTAKGVSDQPRLGKVATVMARLSAEEFFAPNSDLASGLAQLTKDLYDYGKRVGK